MSPMSTKDFSNISPIRLSGVGEIQSTVVDKRSVYGTYPHASLESGNILPSRGSAPPRIAYAVLYEVAKGFGIRRSVSRMSKFYISKESIEDILTIYRRIRDTSPSPGKYRDLMTAVAEYHGFDYKYEKTDYGNLLKVWGKDGREWQFPITRGESRKRKSYSRDYIDALDIDSLSDTQFMGYGELLKGVEGDVSGLYKRLVDKEEEDEEDE